MTELPGLRVPSFTFDSPLAAKAMRLERLRADLPRETAHLPVLRELSGLLRLLASIVSARIEGNRTTIVDAVAGAQTREARPSLPLNDSVEEILRLEDAADFIDANVEPGAALTHVLVRELHRLATHDLDREGDATPGQYRAREVKINGAEHRPPLASTVHSLMGDLLDFANEPVNTEFQLLRMAIAHHRFVWIHPFTNGNGRVARLFSYAMIRRYGFAPDVSYQTINPTTVFGADRAMYYERLAGADSLEDEGLLAWCDFVLGGLLRDLEAIRRLASGSELQRLLENSIDSARRAGQLTAEEAGALRLVADGREFMAGELIGIVGGAAPERSRFIHDLLERQLLRRTRERGRKYRIRLSPNSVTPFVLAQLDRAGVVPPIASDEL